MYICLSGGLEIARFKTWEAADSYMIKAFGVDYNLYDYGITYMY